METILVDDELWGLKSFEIECADVEEIEVIGSFQNPLKALELAESQRVDLAILDVEMPEMTGLDLSDRLRELYPDIIIFFVSAYDKYMVDAMSKRKADHYLLKPYTADDVRAELERAKLLSARQRKKVRIHTFGNFEVYADGKPVSFTSPKAKELLALLVDAQGESVTAEDAFSMMWEQLDYNHTEAGRYRKALSKLQATLVDAGIENILSYFPRARAIRRDMVECDYFDLLAEKPRAIKEYSGRYMNQYSWGEERIALLNRIKMRHDPNAEDILYE